MFRTIATGLATLTLVFGLGSSQARAQALAGHSGVRDHAHMFSAEAVKKADTALENLRGQTRWQVVIETVDSLEGKTARQAALDNAKELKIHGLYVLIAKKEHHVELEPSDSARKVFSSEGRREIVSAVTTAFKAKEFDKGLHDAVALVRKEAGLSAEIKPAPEPPAPAETSKQKKAVMPPITLTPAPPAVPPAEVPAGNGGSVMWLVIVGVVVVFLLWIVARIFRRPAMIQQPPSNAMMGTGAGYGPRPTPGQPGGYPPQAGYPPQPGYGPPPPGYGYGPPPPPQRGGGFMSGMLGGLGGAIAGNILYDQFGRPHQGPAHTEGNVIPPHAGTDAPWPPADAASQPGETYDPNAATGGDWGSGDANEPAADAGATGGDWGGGSDDSGSAGGDWGGGDDSGGGGDDSGSAGGDWGGGGDAGSDQTQGGDW